MPVIAKDNFDTRGVPTTNGAAALLDAFPKQDATMVSLEEWLGWSGLPHDCSNLGALDCSNIRITYVLSHLSALGVGPLSFAGISRSVVCLFWLTGIGADHDSRTHTYVSLVVLT